MERWGHVAKGGGSPALRLAAAARAPANERSLPICGAQFPPPGLVPGTRGSWALGVALGAPRGRSEETGAALCDPHGSARTWRGAGLSAPGRGAVGGRRCARWGLCGGGRRRPLQARMGTDPLPAPPGCPSAGSPDRTRKASRRGAPARLSPGAPPPLRSEAADWPAGRPVPHHAPRESSSPAAAVPGFRVRAGAGGRREMIAPWAWGLGSRTGPPPPQSEGARSSLFSISPCTLTCHSSVSPWGETVT